MQARPHDDYVTPLNRQFNFPPLDDLVSGATLDHDATHALCPPIIELLSLSPGGGKTHVLYHLITLAILPKALGGRESSVALIDIDHAFSVDRLVNQIRRHLRSRGLLVEEGMSISSSLQHLHIFRPQSLASTTATLRSLPEYLLCAQRHVSFEREVSFIAIDSISTLYWQERSEKEDATVSFPSDRPSTETGYTAFARALKGVMSALCCPAIITTQHLGPLASSQTPGATRAFRPSLPPAISFALRLVVRRVQRRKLPPMIAYDTATQESEQRLSAVQEGLFRVTVNEWGIGLKRGGWDFTVHSEGVDVKSETE